jgi:hypothetical protein
MFPGIPGHEPVLNTARHNARNVSQAREELVTDEGRLGEARSRLSSEHWGIRFWAGEWESATERVRGVLISI